MYRRNPRTRQPTGAIVGLIESDGSVKVGWSLVAKADRKTARKEVTRCIAIGRAVKNVGYGVTEDLPPSLQSDGTLTKFLNVLAEALSRKGEANV